jgi:hypothetical protein
MSTLTLKPTPDFHDLDELAFEVRLAYRATKPLAIGSDLADRLLADPETTRAARALVLRNQVCRARALACTGRLVESPADRSHLGETDAAANLTLEAVEALRSSIGAAGAADTLRALAACVDSDDLDEAVFAIVDNVRRVHWPYGGR